MIDPVLIAVFAVVGFAGFRLGILWERNRPLRALRRRRLGRRLFQDR